MRIELGIVGTKHINGQGQEQYSAVIAEPTIIQFLDTFCTRRLDARGRRVFVINELELVELRQIPDEEPQVKEAVEKVKPNTAVTIEKPKEIISTPEAVKKQSVEKEVINESLKEQSERV